MTKLLKITFSTPWIAGRWGRMLGVPLLGTNPCDASVVPTLPTGVPRMLTSRRYEACSWLTVREPNVLVSLRLISWARPSVAASNPGTVAPPCCVGYGLSSA